MKNTEKQKQKMIAIINENGLTRKEQDDILAKLKQKIDEMHNPNLNNANAEKIVLLADLFRLCLTREGELLLRWKNAAADRLRKMFLKRMHEFALLNVAQTNAEYMAAATQFEALLEDIANTA